MSIKAIFVSVFTTVASVLAGAAIWQLATGASPIPWLGVLLASLPLPVTLGYWMITKRVSRTGAGMPALTGPAFAGLGLTALPLLGVGEGVGPWPPVLAAIGAAGTMGYVYWYSVFGRAPSDALTVGDPLPSFTLEDTDGKPVSSDDLRGAPTILLFYRGNWCPLCMAQIKEIARMYRELDARGARVRLVSPQPHDNTRKLAERFDAPFDFLVDPGNRAARRLGIASPDGVPAGMEAIGYDTETVMPTVVITDAEGTILFCDETDNYRVRPEPETFLKILDAHAAET